jgi:thiol-disulfide isomerase/thioredoxin
MSMTAMLPFLTQHLVAAVALALCPPAVPDKTGCQIGERVADLHFKDIHYLPRSLNDFPKAKAFVLVFLNTTCPVAQRYLPLLRDLEKSYRGKGVQFLAVNVAADDSIVAMAAQAVEHDMEFPFVKDFDFSCVQALGVRRTPEVVVLNADRRLCYRGWIDDQYRLGGTRPAPSRQDLREALDEVLASRAVTLAETPVDGCLISLPTPPTTMKPVTFAEGIAPILRKHCQECHRPGTSAPFSLVSYKQVAARADTVAEVIAEGRMPPWYASDEFGPFINHRGLSAAERDTILEWVRSGKPAGDESKLPPPPAADAEAGGHWLIGKPDLVVSALEHQLPASGDIPYKYVFLPHAFTEDTWMQRIQILPDQPRVVHHCNMLYFAPGDSYKERHFLTGTVPGGSPMSLDDGMGFLIPKGSRLLLQIHYVSTGKPEKCRISVGFRHARGIVNKQLRHKLLDDNKFAIPPGAPAYPVAASKVFEQDADALALFVHMHVRGRDMQFRAHYPDGSPRRCCSFPITASTGKCPTAGSRARNVSPGGRAWKRWPTTTTPPSIPITPTPTSRSRKDCKLATR